MSDTVGPRLRKLRHERGLLLKDVQRITGLPVSAVSSLERGLPRYQLATYADRLAQALGPGVYPLAAEAEEARLRVRDGVEIEDLELREAAAELLDRALPAGLLPGVSAIGTSVLKLSPDVLIIRRRPTRVYAGATSARLGSSKG